MASLFSSRTCPIPSWSMHGMSRSSYIIALDALYRSNCILHRNGLCWAKSRLYQVKNCLIIVSKWKIKISNMISFSHKIHFQSCRACELNTVGNYASISERLRNSRQTVNSTSIKSIDVKFSNYFSAISHFAIFHFLLGRARPGGSPSFTSEHHRVRVVLSAKAHHM